MRPLLAALLPLAVLGQNLAVRPASNGGVEIALDGKSALVSPEQGLFSIACQWRDGWPAAWAHASGRRTETAGDWLLFSGVLQACGGQWDLLDAYRVEGRAVKGIRRFTWKGPGRAPRATLSVRFLAPAAGSKVLLPGILYYGNPSGARSGKVPVYSGRPGEEAFFEEHRYPLPFAFAEAGALGVALHSLPSPAAFANLRDQWWSLGVAARPGATELALLSGPCASNGKRGVVKALQPGFLPYDNAWLDIPAGAVIEKTFWLEAFPVTRDGDGFRRPLETSLALFAPHDSADMPTVASIVRDKYRLAKSRWLETGGAAGFRKYPDRPFFVMGWTGQAAAPGYALPVLAPGLKDPAIPDMVRKSLDFLTTARFFEAGFHNWYDYEKREWTGNEPLSQAQDMLSFARAIGNAGKAGQDTTSWEAFLKKACDLHARRILDPSWKPLSTAEAYFIAPLAEASRLFSNDLYRRAALKAGETFAARHLSMREPYWGGTLDASCEDKEGAYAAFQGFLALYELTGRPDHLAWARHACDVALTYLVVWDIDLPPGRLRDNRLKTRGWTVVSPQNQHIDAYGVVMAPDLYRLAQIVGRDDLKRLAMLMYRSCGQMIDPWGSQGEQLHQTNYAQRGRVDDVFALRGGYREEWTVFWITAHFLTAAARFVELGLDIW